MLLQLLVVISPISAKNELVSIFLIFLNGFPGPYLLTQLFGGLLELVLDNAHFHLGTNWQIFFFGKKIIVLVAL